MSEHIVVECRSAVLEMQMQRAEPLGMHEKLHRRTTPMEATKITPPSPANGVLQPIWANTHPTMSRVRTSV